MHSIALTKTDRAKKIGGFVWLVITKLAQGIAFVIKKINWNKVGFVSCRLVVLAFGVVIAFAKLIGSMIAGLKKIENSAQEDNERFRSKHDWKNMNSIYDHNKHYGNIED